MNFFKEVINLFLRNQRSLYKILTSPNQKGMSPTSAFIVIYCRFRFMVFNTTFKNISVISWQSVLLVEETGVPRENHKSLYLL
jgi:hypothetical protein